MDREAADVHAEDGARVLLGLRTVVGELDAAGLAAAADQDLRFDDAGIAELVGRRDGLLDSGGGGATGHRHPMTGEQLLALVFE